MDHIRWMRQKDLLGQDMFLVGMHGPLRRMLAFIFCEKAGREMEYLALTQDTTESDLKQRREILPGGSSEYVDMSAVNAALYGRILIVEGLEKVERNVMPVLNNLLENREIALEDGRFLLPQERYDSMTEQQRKESNLVPVHPNFRVIALGVPVPPFPGNPLDPPLRSRFQGRRIEPAPRRGLISAIRDTVAPSLPDHLAQNLCQYYRGIYSLGQQAADEQGEAASKVAFHELMYLGEAGVLSTAKLLETFPQLSVRSTIDRVYPPSALYPLTQVESRTMIEDMTNALGYLDDPDAVTEYRIVSTLASTSTEISSSAVTLTFAAADGGDSVELTVPGGVAAPRLLPQDAGTMQDHHWNLLTQMLQSHCVGRDLLVIGERGSGKTFMASQFANALGYAPVETLFIYADMTSRDLLQRRTTGEQKETLWQPTPLAIAVRTGRLAILDGINRLPPGTISALLRLVEDREITLFDGSRYVRPDRYATMMTELGLTEAELTARGIFMVHPSFRILALATPPSQTAPWLTNEMLNLFHFFSLEMDIRSDIGREHAALLVDSVVPNLEIDVAPRLATLGAKLADAQEEDERMQGSMSLRMMLRVARRTAVYTDDLSDAINMNMMTMFMPTDVRQLTNGLMSESGLEGEMEGVRGIAVEAVPISMEGDVLHIGDISYTTWEPGAPELVPDIVFYDVPSHTLILRSMLKDYGLGEHILLMGNQGVGKNKLTDRLLMLMKRERQYIQLHRDTTVPTLTLNPSLKDGRIFWEDSPLVRAMSSGQVLVVDEFDKAPVEVVCVLKGLLEDGEILLADGRRFVSPKSVLYDTAEAYGTSVSGAPNLLETRVCQIHPNFRVIALANRPCVMSSLCLHRLARPPARPPAIARAVCLSLTRSGACAGAILSSATISSPRWEMYSPATPSTTQTKAQRWTCSDPTPLISRLTRSAL
jgi:MoxR-like ATPase